MKKRFSALAVAALAASSIALSVGPAAAATGTVYNKWQYVTGHDLTTTSNAGRGICMARLQYENVPHNSSSPFVRAYGYSGGDNCQVALYYRWDSRSKWNLQTSNSYGRGHGSWGYSFSVEDHSPMQATICMWDWDKSPALVGCTKPW